MREEIIKKVKEKKVIAIVRNVYGEDCRKLTEALLSGGIALMEFTFDQKNPENWEKTCANIKMVRSKFEGRMYCGAGTVLTMEQVDMAAEVGAQFIVSPNVKREVIQETIRKEMVSMPGAMTATEAVEAAEYGAAERRGQHPRAFAVRNKADQQEHNACPRKQNACGQQQNFG